MIEYENQILKIKAKGLVHHHIIIIFGMDTLHFPEYDDHWVLVNLKILIRYQELGEISIFIYKFGLYQLWPYFFVFDVVKVAPILISQYGEEDISGFALDI